MYLAVELRAGPLRQFVNQVAVFAIQRRVRRQVEPHGDLLQLRTGLGVILDHHLAELFHLGAGGALSRERSCLDLRCSSLFRSVDRTGSNPRCRPFP